MRFEEGRPRGDGGQPRSYDLDDGLARADAATNRRCSTPHVVNEQIAVDANRIDVTLAGPKIKATGNVKSVLQPRPKPGGNQADVEDAVRC